MAIQKGIDLLAEYVFLSKYSQKKENGYLETWEETIDRIYSMHTKKLEDLGLLNDETKAMLNKCSELEKQRKILSSQRGRQFASSNPNSGILKHETKMYNCCSTYIDRVDVFGEIMYLLLCGCGVGYSLHKDYVNKLPIVSKMTKKNEKPYIIDDSIEGWADSIKILMNGLFNGIEQVFDFSKIRKEGTLIDKKFIAPGPESLMKAHDKIKTIMQHAQGRKLKTIEIHDILCYIAECVVSGGVRRSAMIALFDKDDIDMLTAKTGSWWNENPQRAMANNSMAVARKDALSFKEIKDALKIVKQFGEPGFINIENYEYTTNPCGEIVMKPNYEGEDGIKRTGFAFCNLVEINGERMDNKNDFLEACRMASFIATVQALYTDFKYLSIESKQIAERDRAIGVSITGIYSNPLLRGKILQDGAKVVSNTNAIFAEKFGIKASKACTTVKPSGNASSILGLFCSGIHPAHAKKYIRRVRIKTNSPEYKTLKDTPLVKWLRGDEAVISFPIESNNKNLVTKDDICSVEHLKFIGMVKHYWINKGHLPNSASNNISATVEVKEHDWDEVAAVLYTNDYLYTGVSLLPSYGDQIYDNAPFQRLSTPELEKEYNDIINYLENNTINFNEIMSNRDNIISSDMAAIGCSGGACELR